MDGTFHLIVFLLFVRSAIGQNCDCKLVDILRNIVQREMMEREMLVSRVEMLESKQGSVTSHGAGSSGYSSEANILERLSVIETMIENINNKLKETSTERQNGARLYSALTNAWRIHKHALLVTNENIETKINDNNNRFNLLTREAEKSIEVVELKVESLINQTNEKASKQLKKVEDKVALIHIGLNKTFKDYTTQMNTDFKRFVNKTDRIINEISSDECASDPCKNGATCVDGIQRYTCICLAGYSGFQCQIDVNECESNPCLNGATCVTGINNYACKCAAGFEGTNCQIDINECSSSPCKNGASCVDGLNNYACICALGYSGTNCQIEGQDCTDIRKRGVQKSGVYTISLWKTKKEIQVFCDMSTDNGGWTVFQNRFDGSVDFYQNLSSYENGFGHLSGEFWLGLKYVQEMTSMSQTELRLDLSAADGTTAYEIFQNFRLTEGPYYKLTIDRGTGTAGDGEGLSYNKGYSFTTFDHDADGRSDNCADVDHGGWWYVNCAYANLNGEYITPGTVSSGNSGERGMTYRAFKGFKSLQTSKMMFRRNIG